MSEKNPRKSTPKKEAEAVKEIVEAAKVFAVDDDRKTFELVVISEPGKLSPTYTNISYFVGNCIPFVGNCRPFCGGTCGFFPLICNTISNSGNDKDAWKKVTGARKSIIRITKHDSDENNGQGYYIDQASGPSCLEIEDVKPTTPRKKTNENGAQTSPINNTAGTTFPKDTTNNQKKSEVPHIEVFDNCEELSPDDPTKSADDPEVHVVVFTRESVVSMTHADLPVRPRQKSVRTKSMLVDTGGVPSDADYLDVTPHPIIVETTQMDTIKKQLYDVHTVETRHIDLRGINAMSATDFHRSVVAGLKVGLSGMREFVEKRASNLTNHRSQWDFIDHFAAKDGCKYIGILEQFDNQYKEVLDDLLSATSTKPKSKIISDAIAKRRPKIEEAGHRLATLHQIVAVDEEMHFLEFNFPLVLEDICSKFSIDLRSKLTAISKMHNYGVQMIHHWVKRLETKTKPVLTKDVFEVAIEFMADIMVICFAIFTKIVEFIHKLAEGPTKEQREKYTLEFLIKTIRSLLDCICDEIGALAEACGQIVIRIPNLTKEDVTTVMTKLYTQVNYADINASRAIEAMEPVIHVYYIRRFILPHGSYKPPKPKAS